MNPNLIQYCVKLTYECPVTHAYPFGVCVDVTHHDSMAGALAYATKRDREHRPCAEQPHSFFAVEISEVEV